MSDTPRTNHFISIRKWEDGQEPLDAWAKFARTLERELAAAQSELARLAQSNAELATEVERLRKQITRMETYWADAAVRRALSGEGE